MGRLCVFGILLLGLLTGCAGAPAGRTAEGAGEGKVLQTADETLRMERETETLLLLPEEEVRQAYCRAQEAWDWFSVGPLPHGREAVEVGGATYWKVVAPDFPNMAALEERLKWLFSEELAGELLRSEAETPPYREAAGELYVWGELYTPGDHSRGEQQLHIERETETRYTVNVTVELLDEASGEVTGLEFWSFPYELVENRWVFTAFAGLH